MDEPNTFHVWMPDGRSLCDRRARPRLLPGKVSEAEAEQVIAEESHAPACGSCLSVAVWIRYEAAALMVDHRVYPADSRDSWQLLLGTRWAKHFAFPEFLLQLEGTDGDSGDYQRLMTAIDSTQLTSQLDDLERKLAETRSWVEAHRNTG
jgi:hypothetical protein